DMSGRVKIRCARCGTSFRSASAKQTLCANCEARARRERAAHSTAAKPAVAPVTRTAPKIVGPGASILVPGAQTTAGAAPTDTGAFDSAARAESPPSPSRTDAHDGRDGQVER